MTALPADLDVDRRLALVRAEVLDATTRIRSPRRSTRYRVTRTVILGTAAAALLTGGAIVIAQATQQQIDSTVHCYEHADLGSTAVVVQTDELGGPMDPIAECSFVWQLDGFSETPADEPTGAPVPELVACTRPDGVPAVLPREDGPPSDTDFCAALGLADWDSD